MVIVTVCAWIAFFRALPVLAVQRFPRPDFTTGYIPSMPTVPAPRYLLFEYLDVAVLAATLALAAYLALRRRSRRGLLLLTMFSLAWFGFWRRGCVCSVGSIQNLAQGWADVGYVIPLTVLAFFVLPLLFALFTGRTFCASVCPLGAVQELLVWRPVKVPSWLQHTLGMIPWVYLGVAVLFAATGSGFLICKWDPFVGLFRLGASFPMLLFGGGVLVLSLFVGRPYCRFLCPYGALLGVMSRLSLRHVTITPAECVQCRLCEDACPYGAIRKPLAAGMPEPRRKGIRRLIILMVVTPLAVLLAAGAGLAVGKTLSRCNRDVALAFELQQETSIDVSTISLERDAFLRSGRSVETLNADASAIRRQFAVGGSVLGAFLAVVWCLRLFGLSVWRSRTDYEPDRARCFSCGRCFEYCPVGRTTDRRMS